MSFELMFITNDPEIAKEAETAGVDRIFVDLEIRGKMERQGHLDTHIVKHTFDDIKAIKAAIKDVKILTRINPYYEGTAGEVEKAIANGSDVIMLPLFKTVSEVEKFIEAVDGRAKTCLLIETPQALARASEILRVEGIDEVHIGLNDLHLGMDLDFMFELLSSGLVEYLAEIIKDKRIKFGFGGIARVGDGILPAEYILGEHVRLGSQMVILSRTFHQRAKSLEDLNHKMSLSEEVAKVRHKIREIKNWSPEQFEENRDKVKASVRQIVSSIKSYKTS